MGLAMTEEESLEVETVENCLLAEHPGDVEVLGLEELLREVRHYVWVVELAAEDIQVDVVALVGEVAGDQRRLDELGHREASDALVLAKVNNDGIAEALHAYEVAEFADELFDLLAIAEGGRVAGVEIELRGEAPGVGGFVALLQVGDTFHFFFLVKIEHLLLYGIELRVQGFFLMDCTMVSACSHEPLLVALAEARSESYGYSIVRSPDPRVLCLPANAWCLGFSC